MAKQLKSFNYGGFESGYNNYSGSKSTIKDTEYPPSSTNVMPADRGSVRKAPGAQRFGNEVSPGYAILNGIQFKTASIDRLIVHCGTQPFYKSGNSYVAMTGLTLASDKPAWFCQALDRVYCSQQGLGGLYVSTNGSSWSLVTNGRELVSMAFINQRLYGIDTATGYVWYSNPFSVTTSPPAIALSNFGTFDTDLTATPKKNAGFIQFVPGGGVFPSCLFKDNEVLYGYTPRNGYFKIQIVSEPLADGSVAHSVTQANGYFGTSAPFSVGKVGNDQWFDDGQMVNSLGEVALYQNIRVSPQYGRVKADLQAKNPNYPQLPALGFHDTVVYYAYPVGSFNDRVIAYDTILKANGSPLVGFNCAFFMEFFDGTTKRILYGSSDPSDSYVYEMGSGTDIGGTPVNATFETKSTSCGRPGLVKRLAKARVYYTSLFGAIPYEIVLEETRSLTGVQQVGVSANLTVGLGSRMLGSRPLGSGPTGYVPATLQTNSYFDVDGEFEAFERAAMRFSNSASGESFQIDDVEFIFQEGNVFEELDGSTTATGSTFEGDDETGTYS